MRSIFGHKHVSLIYTIILFIFFVLGFCYSADSYEVEDGLYMDFTGGWEMNGEKMTFPYYDRGTFTMETTLPELQKGLFLIMDCYYLDYTVSIDGQVMQEAEENELFGRTTYIGKRRIVVPLREEDAGKQISVTIQMQNDLYASAISDAFITTLSGYKVKTISENTVSIIMFIIYIVTGLAEMGLALFYLVTNRYAKMKFAFRALLFSEMFSIMAGLWIFNDSGIPYVLWGHITGFSIINMLAFLLMPFCFFGSAKTINDRENTIDNVIELIMASAILICCTLCVFGVLDWSHLLYLAHAMDIAVIFIAAYYTYAGLHMEEYAADRHYVAVGTLTFLGIMFVALMMYIRDYNSNYIGLIMGDFFIYTLVQLGLVYRRISLRVEEKTAFTEVKEAALTDVLTGLSNRRAFYEEMNAKDTGRLPYDLTVISVDINRLKHYNDTMGHDAGDELIVGTGEGLREAFADIEEVVIARMGGDEFMILGILPEEQLQQRIDHLRDYLRSYKGQYVDGIEVSIGAAAARDYIGLSLPQLIQRSDAVMYKEKKLFYETSGYDRREN